MAGLHSESLAGRQHDGAGPSQAGTKKVGGQFGAADIHCSGMDQRSRGPGWGDDQPTALMHRPSHCHIGLSWDPSSAMPQAPSVLLPTGGVQ